MVIKTSTFLVWVVASISSLNAQSILKSHITAFSSTLGTERYYLTHGSNLHSSVSNKMYLNSQFIGNAGRQHEESFEFELFPNPTQGRFSIRSNTTITKIDIIDVLGNKIAEYHNGDIQLEQMSDGIYYAKATNNSGQVTTRKIYLQK
jgi:hypothetical protein